MTASSVLPDPSLPAYSRPRPVTPHAEEFVFAPSRLTVTALGRLARDLAAETALWQDKLRYDEHERWFAHLRSGELYDVWLLSWAPGQYTSLHDHGGSSGAFHVLQGAVTETVVRPEPDHAEVGRPGRVRRVEQNMSAGTTAQFGPHYVHDVRHGGVGPAATLHVYSPPLGAMNYYDTVDGRLQKVGSVQTVVPEPGWPRRTGG